MATVEGPRNVQENEQREDFESNLEQDACASVDGSLGGLSLMDLRPEGADAEDHELKVIVHVESVKSEASAQEREMEPPSKRRKQESDQIPMHFSLCDDSSDQGAKSVDDSTELETSRRPDAQLDDIMAEMRDVKSERQGAGRNSGPQRKVC